jgi:plasmid stability protein
MRFFPLDLNRWLKKEFERETGFDPESLEVEAASVLGVHHNTDSGAIDILAYLGVNANIEQLAEKIHIEHQLDDEEQEARARGTRWSSESREYRKQELLAEFKRSGHLIASRGAPELQVAGTKNVFVPFTPDEIENFVAKVAASDETVLPEARQVLSGALKAEHGRVPKNL